MKVQVSKQDKNLISMMVLAEMVGRSIVNMVDDKLKDSDKFSQVKIDFYNEIKSTFIPFTNTATQINTAVNDEFLRIYSSSEMSVMMDSVIAVIDLLEHQNEKQIQSIMRAAGWRGQEAFFAER